MSETLFMQERRRAIIEQLQKEGRVSVRDLSATLNVSMVTIRQDLQALEDSGQLERTHGGAVLPVTTMQSSELSFEIRLGTHNSIKDRIAKKAAGLVNSGDSIALDASTSVFAMLPYLKLLNRLIIVTNSLVIARNCLDSSQIDVIMPGGSLRRDSISLVGQPENLPGINLNMGFFGGHGISPEQGIMESSLEESHMKQAMMSRCLSNVFLLDSSKWGRVAPYTLLATDATPNHIITSSAAPDTMLSVFREKGTEISLIPEN